MASLSDTHDALDELAADYFAAVRDHGRGSGLARELLAGGAHRLLLAHGALLSSESHGAGDGDVVRGWTRKRIRVLAPGESGWVSNSELVADLKSWCATVGAECPDMPSRAIGKHLGMMGARGARARVKGEPQARGWRVKLIV